MVESELFPLFHLFLISKKKKKTKKKQKTKKQKQKQKQKLLYIKTKIIVCTVTIFFNKFKTHPICNLTQFYHMMKWSTISDPSLFITFKTNGHVFFFIIFNPPLQQIIKLLAKRKFSGT